MPNFKKWLEEQPTKTAIVKLPKDKEIVLDIPKELQHEKILEDEIPCNQCPTGSTTLWIYTKEINFTLRDGDVFMVDELDGFTEEELNGLGRLVEEGIIIPKVY